MHSLPIFQYAGTTILAPVWGVASVEDDLDGFTRCGMSTKPRYRDGAAV